MHGKLEISNRLLLARQVLRVEILQTLRFGKHFYKKETLLDFPNGIFTVKVVR